jgi:type VI secretion system protein ImpE
MTAEEHIKAGNLTEALAELQAQVKKKPADSRLRVFLFQLLAVMGQWERAASQLEVAGEMDAEAATMRQMYREVLRCELLRREVFAGRKSPLVFGEPAEWVAMLLQASQLVASDKFEEARALRDKAFEAAPAVGGSIDDQPFAWIADADPRLGPMLEAIVNGRYYWVPFMRLREIRIEKPVDLRDVAWTPVALTFANGGETVALIPTRYPGSEGASDPRVVMARRTEWLEKPGETFLGLGQRLLATDQGEFPLMDARVIKLASPDGQTESERAPATSA